MKDKLLREHREIEGLAQALRDGLRDGLRQTPPDLEALAEKRWRLAKAMMQHLAFEDRNLALPLERHSDPAVSAVALLFKAHVSATQADYEAHTARWTATAMAADWRGYCAASLQQLDVLADRIRREERELFPLIPRLADVAGPIPAAQRNWARAAWDVHAALDRT